MRGIDLDWRRISRWCFVGAIVMVVWLLVPTVRCSWRAFRDTPISAMDPAAEHVGQADRARLEHGKGFVDDVTTSVKACYAKTPLLDQEEWKTDLLFALVALAIVAGAVARYEARKKRTYIRS